MSSSSDDDLFLAEYLSELAKTRTMQLVYASAFTIMLFEYLITFDRELRYAWFSRLTWAKTMFFLNRYISLLAYGASLYTLSSPSFLRFAYAVFSGLRLFAIGQGRKWVTYGVAVLSLVPAGTNIALAACSKYFIVVDPDSGNTGCDYLYAFSSDKTFSGAMLLVNSLQIYTDLSFNETASIACIYLNVAVPILISRFYLDLGDFARDNQEKAAKERFEEEEPQNSN
ncbi:uncharacterized protein BXZ73DRAFT_95559 [Epithele typhae]|uniref:uncharacterized protein n=1 Tax=Epithele typhae TaxID=378194 RepID=UPI0020089814|nr:uncharacterized protein BXZ73DRAFT_95559 [Epithele typhae]KAH9946051.1 hypothetical protein BXZ73DRAFT_95559 [Epithele typhae]